MKSRVLALNILGGKFESSGVIGEAPTIIPEGFEYVEATSAGGLVYGILYKIDYFDLSGYRIQKDTTFPRGYNVQDIGVIQSATATSTPNLERAEMLLTKVPRVGDIASIGDYNWHLPGSLNSRYGMEEVLAGLMTRYTHNSTTGQLMVTGSSSWGTGDSTAGEKMFILSAFKFELTGSQIDFTIPPSAKVVPAIFDHEDDLVYNMRLRRSYELQQ